MIKKYTSPEYLSTLPNELYLSLLDVPQDNNRGYLKKFFCSMRIACALAETCTTVFSRVIASIRSSPLLRDLVADQEMYTARDGLRNAFAPAARYFRFLKELYQNFVDPDQYQLNGTDPFATKSEYFFDAFNNLPYGLIKNAMCTSDIRQNVPKIFFKAFQQKWCHDIGYDRKICGPKFGDKKNYVLDEHAGTENFLKFLMTAPTPERGVLLKFLDEQLHDGTLCSSIEGILERRLGIEQDVDSLSIQALDDTSKLSFSLADIDFIAGSISYYSRLLQQEHVALVEEHIKRDLLQLIRSKNIYQLFLDRIVTSQSFTRTLQTLPWLWNDVNFMMAALAQSSHFFFQASEAIQQDERFLCHALRQDAHIFSYLSPSQQADKKYVLLAVARSGLYLEKVHESFQGDYEVVLAAVQQDGFALKFASKELQNNLTIVRAAVNQDGDALEFASQELRELEEIVLAAVRQDGRSLEFAPECFHNSDKIVLTALAQNGYALEFVSQEMKNRADIVLAAVRKNGGALEEASATLRNNDAVVMAAVQQDGLALHFASERLKNDAKTVLKAVEKDGLALEEVSEALRDDHAIVMAAVQQNGLALQFASERLKDDPTIVLAAITSDSFAIEFASERLKNDPLIRDAIVD